MCIDPGRFATYDVNVAGVSVRAQSGRPRLVMSLRFMKDRLVEAGRVSARRAQAEHKGVILACEFKGVCGEAGDIDPNGKIRKTSNVCFEWTARTTHANETSVVTQLCDNVCRRRVPLPRHWKTTIQCLSFDDVARNSSARMRQQHEAREVECDILGVPKESPLPSASATLQVGASVTLQVGDANLDYLLCAHIQSDR